MSQESNCRVEKRKSFAQVDDLLFSLDMSPVAFKVAAWALGRPPGWKFSVGHMMKTLNLSDKTWPRAKADLVRLGFFKQKKFRDGDNKFHWENIFTDDPLYLNEPQIGVPPVPPQVPKVPIPPVGMDGKGMDAVGSDAAGGNIAAGVNHISKAAAAAIHAGNENPTQNHVVPQEVGKELLEKARGLGLVIQNIEDEVVFKTMIEEHGEEAIREGVKLVLKRTAKRRPYVSNVLQEILSAKQAKTSRDQAFKDKQMVEDAKRKGRESAKKIEKFSAEKLSQLQTQFVKYLEMNESNQFNKQLLLHVRKDGFGHPAVKVEFGRWIAI